MLPEKGDPFEALGDPRRREIVELLASGPRPVHEIAAVLPISRPAVSRHLRLLKASGLVTDEVSGRERVYRLDEPGVAAVRDYLTGVWGEVVGRFRLFAENTTPASDPGVEEAR